MLEFPYDSIEFLYDITLTFSGTFVYIEHFGILENVDDVFRKKV